MSDTIAAESHAPETGDVPEVQTEEQVESTVRRIPAGLIPGALPVPSEVFPPKLNTPHETKPASQQGRGKPSHKPETEAERSNRQNRKKQARKKLSKSRKASQNGYSQQQTSSHQRQLATVYKVDFSKQETLAKEAPEPKKPKRYFMEGKTRRRFYVDFDYASPFEKRFAGKISAAKNPKSKKETICPHPFKMSFVKRELAMDFIKEKFPEDETIEPYRCVCGALHIGHPSNGRKPKGRNHKEASAKIRKVAQAGKVNE